MKIDLLIARKKGLISNVSQVENSRASYQIARIDQYRLGKIALFFRNRNICGVFRSKRFNCVSSESILPRLASATAARI